MGDCARPRVIIVIIILLFTIPIVRDNFSIDSVVDSDKINHDGKAEPVAEDVEAGKDFFDTAVDVTHLHLEARLTILSYEMYVDNQQQPTCEKYVSYKELDT